MTLGGLIVETMQLLLYPMDIDSSGDRKHVLLEMITLKVKRASVEQVRLGEGAKDDIRLVVPVTIHEMR